MLNSIFLLGLPGGFEWIIILFVFLIPGVLWLWAIIDLLTHDFTDSNMKLIWAVIIVFVPFIGSILYLIMSKRHKVTS